MLFACVSAFVLGVYGRIEGTKSVDWKEVGKASSLESVDVILVLKRDPAVLEKLERIFWEVSDPKNEKYGEYLTQDEVTQLMGIGDDQLNAVTSYLRAKGASVEVGVHRDLIKARLGVTMAEDIFSTALYKYAHIDRPRSKIIRAREDKVTTIPDELQDHVFHVDGLAGFPKLTVQPKTVKLEATTNKTEIQTFPMEYTCNGLGNLAITPKILATRYKTNGPLTSSEVHGAKMAVAEFQDVFYAPYQLENFSQQCGTNATVSTQMGYNNPMECNTEGQEGTDCTEAQLDIEYITAVAGDVPLTDIYTNGYSILDWANTLANMGDDEIPHVNSVSYGNDEAQNPQSYMESCNTEFQKLASRGISVMFAAGDQGVWGREGYENGQQFHPDFPGGSPFVTTVGGTNFAVQSVIGEEEAWTSGGGGFSNVFPMPKYQAEAVAAYKKQPNLPNASLWNQNSARAYPDVSALAGLRNPYLIFSDSNFMGVGGTSAATPVFSAMIAKLNAMRFAKGGKPMGFLNPWLYQNADAFNDVTLGNNGGVKPGSGFPATTGWDAATGLGTPDFEMLSTRI